MHLKWKRQAMGIALSAAMTVTSLPFGAVGVMAAEETPKELLNFTFDNEKNGFESNGYKAEIVGSDYEIDDDETYGKVLNLKGKTYLNVSDEDGNSPLDGLDEVTINYYSKPTGNDHYGWTVFAVRDDEKPEYQVSEHYLGVMDKADSVTVERHLVDNASRPQALSSRTDDEWRMVTVVYAKDRTKLYINGEKADEVKTDASVSDILRDNSTFKIGKANWGEEYFIGEIDNYSIYSGALSDENIAKMANLDLPLLRKVKSDDVTILTQKIDRDKKTAALYYSVNNTKGDVTAAKLSFKLLSDAKIVDGAEEKYDLTKPFSIKVANAEKEETYTISAAACHNPALGGQYADPDIDCFDGKYYIYPTTDGFEGWSGYQFKVFSSEDLVNWKDEGVILDLKQDDDAENKNENGVKIASVPWSNGNAWAPSIEEKDGRYYFYFCGHDTETNAKAIGVASADSPVGPFTVNEKPLISIQTCKDAGINMGQAIDPSVFKDDDGKYWLSFGNGNAAIVQLNDDMTSIDASTMKNIGGLYDFRESLIITKRNGLYHYTWSCDDTGSENYHINYGTTKKLGDKVEFKGTILKKDVKNDILGTGHHSILNVPGTDNWYIAYARFMTPLGQVSNGYGYHREVCLDKLTFDENGYMQEVTPTNEGISEPVYVSGYEPSEPDVPVTPDEPAEPDVPVTPADPSKPDAPKPVETPVDDNTPKAPENNTITGDNAVLSFGNKYTLKTDFSVKKFVVSDKKVLSVTRKGVVKVKKSGTVTIKAEGKNGESKTFSNIVAEKPVMKSLTVKSTDSIDISKMLSGVTYAVPTAYESSNKSVAEIDANGKITIKGKGRTSITVQFGKKKFKKTLKVKI